MTTIVRRYTTHIADCTIHMVDGKEYYLMIAKTKDDDGYISFVKGFANRTYYLGEVYNSELYKFVFSRLSD